MSSPSRPPSPVRVVVGLAGAAGVDYGVAALAALRERGVETHLIASARSERELAQRAPAAAALATRVYDEDNQAAAVASGSFRASAMIVAPCDQRALAAIVRGLASTLLYRAADVALKEGRPLLVGVVSGDPQAPPPALLARARAIPGLEVVRLEGPADEAAAGLAGRLSPPA